MPNKHPNVAVGILRPRNIFFYDIDCKKGEFREMKKDFKRIVSAYLNFYSIYRTKHGYHVIGNCGNEKFRTWLFDYFSEIYPSDFTKKLKPRFGRKNPQILRISEKFDSRTGRIVSPAPKRIIGDFELKNVEKYKVWYYAK